jgi:hypothetical protein
MIGREGFYSGVDAHSDPRVVPLTRPNDNDVIRGLGHVAQRWRGGFDERDAEQCPGLNDPPAR